MDRTLQAIRAFVAHKLAEGFDPPERVIDQAVSLFAKQEAYCPSYFDFLGGDDTQRPEATVRPAIERITAELFEERRRLEAAWTTPTDCDRLEQAFAELEREGIVTGVNLLCCMTCARAEIGNLITQMKKNGQPVAGHVFYHEQDTARVPFGPLLLAFGSTDNGDEPTRRIGRRVVAALNRAGLQTEWKDDPDARILVRLDWRKRRFR